MDGAKFRRYVFLTVCGLSVLLGPFILGFYLASHIDYIPNVFGNLLPGGGGGNGASLDVVSSISGVKHIHFIIPATNSGMDLCKLLLTGSVLRYPEPTFVGWNHTGIFDGSASHLFKITETLTYLRSLPPTADENLVMIMDGFDLWFMLRPSVLISRYHKILADHDERLKEDGLLGRVMSNFQGVSTTIRSKIVFGADKWPAPLYPSEPYWWAVPPTPYSDDYFGPDTDKNLDLSRPRWLNSGTIMGPVKEMREYFAATVNEVLETANSEHGLEKSDQYYFARVWGRQEIGRSILKDGKEKFMETVPQGARLPNITDGAHTDYGVVMDYWQEAFQLGGGWKEDIIAMEKVGGNSSWEIPQDILDSESPFSAATAEEISDKGKSWADMTLGVNLLSKIIFPVMHMTSAKGLREKWWPQLWFHPHAEILQKAARREQVASDDPDVFMTVEGVKWKQYRRIMANEDKAGAWKFSGEYLPWRDLCGQYEDELYQKKV